MEESHSIYTGHSHLEDSWTCRRCGWVYPNPHPSAKHRRNHKKHCGKIKGFELQVHGTQLHAEGSSDEASSDEEGHTSNNYAANQPREVLSGEHDFDVSSAANQSGPTIGEAAAVREASGSQVPEKNTVVEQPKDFPKPEASLSDDTSLDTETLPDSLRNAASVEQGTLSNPLPALNLQKDGLAYEYTEKEKLGPLEQEVPVTKHREALIPKEGHSQHEDLWTCHRCGWVYPNPHPSAKHRRNHKKHCGKIKGFESKVLSDEPHAEGSSDEASSDEEEHVRKEYVMNRPGEILPSEHYLDVSSASKLPGSTLRDVVAAREDSESDSRQNNMVDKQPEGLLTSEPKASDTEDLADPLQNAISLEQGTLPDSLGLLDVQKDVRADDITEAEKSSSSKEPLVQEMPAAEHTEIPMAEQEDAANLPQGVISGEHDLDVASASSQAGSTIGPAVAAREGLGNQVPQNDLVVEQPRDFPMLEAKSSTVTGLDAGTLVESLRNAASLEQGTLCDSLPAVNVQKDGLADELKETERPLLSGEPLVEELPVTEHREGPILKQEQGKVDQQSGEYSSEKVHFTSGQKDMGCIEDDEGSQMDIAQPKHETVADSFHGKLSPAPDLLSEPDDLFDLSLSGTNIVQPFSTENTDIGTEPTTTDLEGTCSEEKLPNEASLSQSNPILGALSEEFGQPMGTSQEAIITLKSQAIEKPTGSEIHELERKDHDAASKQVLPAVDEIPFDRINKEESLREVGVNEDVFGLDGPLQAPQESITFISTALESDSGNIAEGKIALMESSGVDQSADDTILYYQEDRKSQNDYSPETLSIKQKMEDLVVVSEEKTKGKLDAEETRNQELSYVAGFNLAESSDVNSVSKQDLVTGMQHTMGESEDATKSMEHAAGVQRYIVDSSCVELERVDERTEVRGNEKEISEENLQAQSSMPQEGGLLNQKLLVSSQDDSGLQARAIPGSLPAGASSGFSMQKEDMLGRQFYEAESEFLLGREVKESDSDFTGVFQEAPADKILMASVSQTSDDTEAFMDASESLETCSVGASADENESVDGAGQNTMEDIDQSADINDLKGSLKKQVEEGIFAASENRVAIVESSVPGHVGVQAGLDSMLLGNAVDKAQGIGVMTNVTEFQTPQTTPLLDDLNTQNTQISYTENLKAPSPEAWQEPGAFQEFSADKAQSEVACEEVTLESNVNEQKGQITETEKSHTPLRSLLDKEVKDMAESNQKEPKADAQKNVKTIEGILGSPTSGRKTKTKSIWNHCICCPVVH